MASDRPASAGRTPAVCAARRFLCRSRRFASRHTDNSVLLPEGWICTQTSFSSSFVAGSLAPACGLTPKRTGDPEIFCCPDSAAARARKIPWMIASANERLRYVLRRSGTSHGFEYAMCEDLGPSLSDYSVCYRGVAECSPCRFPGANGSHCCSRM